MKRKNRSVSWFLALCLFAWSSSQAPAVPLSLDSNIGAVLANRADPGEGFDFVVIGDSRDGAEVFGRLLDHARTLNPLFILHTGDAVTHGLPSEYDEYMRRVAQFDIPILHVPGNHDIRDGSDSYRKYVGEPNWYLDLGDYRVVGLDNAMGRFNEATLAFARKALSSQKNCLVAFHMPPPFDRWAAHGMNRTGKWGEVRALVEETRAKMVFLGHLHLYDEMDVGGTKYIVSGGGGAPLHHQHPSGKPQHGFVLVRARAKGITHQWVPLEAGSRACNTER